MAPTSMCDTCKAISFQNLPSVYEDAVPHLSSFNALSESAQSCPLCALLCYALGCSWAGLAGSVTFTPVSTLPSGKKYRSEWEGSMYKHGMRTLENGAMTLDFSPAKPDLREPRFVDPNEYVKDGLNLRPWLFGSWYRSPFNPSVYGLIGLGVRLGQGPRLEDAFGLVEMREDELTISIPGTSLRIRADETVDIATIIPGRLRTEKQNSKRAISQVKTWIKMCEGHGCIDGHSCGSDGSSPELPTRVLDVRAEMIGGGLGVRLIESNGIRDHYIALSHCWGRSERLTTLKSNLEAHLMHIPFNTLAITFQDAVTIARELDIRYVWIDSLCIVQDDYSDWEREAVRMGDVYSNAYLTVAGLGTSDDSDSIFIPIEQRDNRSLVSLDTTSTGRRCVEWAAPLVGEIETSDGVNTVYRPARFFGVCDTPGQSISRSPSRVYVTAEWMPTSTKPMVKTTSEKASDDAKVDVDNDSSRLEHTETYLVGQFGGTVDPFADEPLSKRGWTLQERILSRRTLHYGTDEMYWECQAMVLAEDGAMLRRTFPDRKGILESRASPKSYGKTDEQSTNRKGEDSWYRLVEQYCARELTRPDDKLPALAGLASSIAVRSEDTYVAGLWRSDIIRGLNWSVEVNEPTHMCDDPEHDASLPPPFKAFPTYPPQYRAPSWSWAAFDAKIEFHALKGLRSKGDVLTECIEVQIDHAGEDPFGKVKGGWLKLRAPLCIVLDSAEKDSSSGTANQRVFTQSIQLNSKSEGKKSGSAIFDDAVELPCFAILLSDSSAILLQPHIPNLDEEHQNNRNRGMPTFRRIGQASSLAPWKKEAEVVNESSAPGSGSTSGLAGRFGRMILEKKGKKEKEFGKSGAVADPKGKPSLEFYGHTSTLWDMADGSTQTIVLY